MKARLMMAALVFIALSSIAVAQEKAKKTDISKEKTECCKAKDADKTASCNKAQSTEKKADKAVEAKKTVKKVETKK
ncbi:MAG: hypothetical protein PHS30_11735 [Bacteroidales bacterium]|nr:hypothetical protein [Bacteroidales bacterium]